MFQGGVHFCMSILLLQCLSKRFHKITVVSFSGIAKLVFSEMQDNYNSGLLKILIIQLAQGNEKLKLPLVQ